MKRLGLVVAMLALCAGMPVSAHAQRDPLLEAEGGTESKGGPIHGAGQRDLGANRRVRRTPSTVGRSRSAQSHPVVRRGRRCARVGSTRTCTTYRKGRPRKLCVTRRAGRERCRSAEIPRPRALPRAVSNQGFLTRNIPQVGKIWFRGKGHCSGTLVARGIVITAAHCLYDNQLVGDGAGYLHNFGVMEFTPNSTWNGTESFSGAPDAATVNAAGGVWRVVNAWVPQCYAENNMQCDVGFVELQAARNGAYIGDTLGWWRVVTHLSIPLGARYFVVGYPASGPFSSARLGYGNMQYFCDTRWQGEYWSHAVTSGQNNISSAGCGMTGGASGGPDFILLSDGSWVINGVNSSGEPRENDYSANITWNYSGDVTAGLYCFVLGCGGRSARTSSLDAMSRPIAGSRGRAGAAAAENGD